jgi:hypothetical protein
MENIETTSAEETPEVSQEVSILPFDMYGWPVSMNGFPVRLWMKLYTPELLTGDRDECPYMVAALGLPLKLFEQLFLRPMFRCMAEPGFQGDEDFDMVLKLITPVLDGMGCPSEDYFALLKNCASDCQEECSESCPHLVEFRQKHPAILLNPINKTVGAEGEILQITQEQLQYLESRGLLNADGEATVPPEQVAAALSEAPNVPGDGVGNRRRRRGGSSKIKRVKR